MTRTPIRLNAHPPFTLEEATAIATLAARYDCAVLLEDARGTINLKSVMGLLSLSASMPLGAELICDGPQEGEAAEALLAALNQR